MLILMEDRFLEQAASKVTLTTTLTIPIDWADLDLFGHVNNVMFFKYMQASRLHFCEKLGLTSLNEKNKLSFMVASSRCDFKRPLYYPGTLNVKTKAVWAKNTSFCLVHVLTDNKGEDCGVGEDVLVLFDYENTCKVTLTEDLKKRMGL
jgi:acyl-CoA thioester hydrolase